MCGPLKVFNSCSPSLLLVTCLFLLSMNMSSHPVRMFPSSFSSCRLSFLPSYRLSFLPSFPFFPPSSVLSYSALAGLSPVVMRGLGLHGSTACGILVPRPVIEPTSPSLRK